MDISFKLLIDWNSQFLFFSKNLTQEPKRKRLWHSIRQDQAVLSLEKPGQK